MVALQLTTTISSDKSSQGFTRDKHAKRSVAMKNRNAFRKLGDERTVCSLDKGPASPNFPKRVVRESKRDVDSGEPPSILLAARLGTIYIATSGKEIGAPLENPEELAAKICAALNKDVRIGNLKLRQPEDSTVWDYQPFKKWRPEDLEKEQKYALTVQFRYPLSFTVHVPPKNQKYPPDNLPEDHFVRWDGSSLLVAWVHTVNAAPAAGAGIVVRDVLEEALERAGFDITIQPPTLTHSILRIMARSAGDSITFDGKFSLIDVNVPRSWDADRIVDQLFDRISFVQSAFYRLANLDSLMREIRFTLEDDLAQLLRTQYQRVARMSWRSREYWEGRWRRRHWRRETRQIIARIWLAMSQVRALRVAFSDFLTVYERFLGDGEPNLFQREQEEMVRDVKNLDLTFAEHRAEEIGSRLDNRELVRVTLIAAIVAVVIGAIATAWLAHIFSGLTTH